MLKLKKVIVGLSGGVDSAVTALLLKNKGFDVHGVFMQNWDIADEQGQCSADKDYKDAAIVCDKLGIELHHVNFVKYYWNDVFSNLIKEYESGYTPNPDILCNRHIKFDQFIQYAREHLNADAIATGHYARTSFGSYLEHYQPDTKVKLLRAACVHKDQTFFLSQVHEESLRKVMFPLGELMKTDVKQIAQENGLINVATKKESMGICFIGTRDFKSFISEYIDDKPGKFVDFDTNKQVGEHQGIHQWTVGQRGRLPNYTKPPYIARKILKSNNIFVAQGWYHAALFSDLFITDRAHWIHSKPKELVNNGVLECEFKFQHVQVLQPCTLCESKNGLVVNLKNHVRALTAGQYAVFYRDNECLGSARIVHPGPCQYFYLKYVVKKEPQVVQDNTEDIDEENNSVCVQEDDESREDIMKLRNVV